MDTNITKIIDTIYNELLNNKDGNVADYIPQLAEVNADLFGISICDISGNIYNIGETNKHFCVQSVSKPLSYCIARQTSKYDIHNHVGYEPSGQSFNAFVLNKDNLPHNPMINSGAMMVCSLIDPNKEPSKRFETINKYYNELSGRNNVGFDNSVYLSEQHHADRNMSLAYYMRENNAYPSQDISPSDIQNNLNLYFQCCSITINSEMGSIIASTLANGGVCPKTNKEIFDKSITKDCLSLMYMCGMYDYSGQFAFNIGLPAKSGVSGCLLIVIPNQFGICIWSPRLDSMGNSVRGVEFCKKFTKLTNNKYHIFHTITNTEISIENVIQACFNGDILFISKGIQDNFDINKSDYDNRTPLHLAAVNTKDNSLELLKLLIDNNADINALDRWNNTPINDIINEMNKIKDSKTITEENTKKLKILNDNYEYINSKLI